jgi:formylglycine-generating enzyme required for sulfatase activity/nitrate/TMAO reductase-like tetraheme cytochrome c subunit
MNKTSRKISRKIRYIVLLSFLGGAVFIILSNKSVKWTSTDEFCMSCHVHPHAEETWRLSTHYDNASGVIVHCVECHLPPPGDFHYLKEKAITGARDVYGTIFKDIDKMDWEAKSQLSNAVKYTYEESCKSCHENLFPRELSAEGMDAHLHYSNNPDEIHCLNCHLHVGHFSEDAGKHEHETDFAIDTAAREIYTSACNIISFDKYTETIPGTSVSFDMLPVPGGTFEIGSTKKEAGHRENESPVRQVEVSSFLMLETEVTWELYMAFFRETQSEGRSDQGAFADANQDVVTADAISGPTPPWANPDQGWGFGDRPAITMTYHAAETFCKWLSLKTGKNYRLPTEAEWEYAARGGTKTPYFFDGDPKKFTQQRWWNRIFGADTTMINRYVIYDANSQMKTQPADSVLPNPFGLKNMLGNVWEFCSDFYAPNAYAEYPEGQTINNPTGPSQGEERVIRGGTFGSDAYMVRSAVRDQTQSVAWLVTDPQIPKSIWWYSDSFDVGFRVVLEWDSVTSVADNDVD